MSACEPHCVGIKYRIGGGKFGKTRPDIVARNAGCAGSGCWYCLLVSRDLGAPGSRSGYFTGNPSLVDSAYGNCAVFCKYPGQVTADQTPRQSTRLPAHRPARFAPIIISAS